MKLSDYVADFLRQHGIQHVFAIAGGASLHLIDSIARTPGIRYVCPQHEQAGAMAADAYARVTGRLGAAISTSGPGATNMATGVCCAYYDSVPVLYITGQVATFRSKADTGVRQLGFQETDVVAMFRPITKYAATVTDAGAIRYELEKACYLATTGRPGPVLIDIPDDVQRRQVDPARLASFQPSATPSVPSLEREVDECVRLLAAAARPVLIVGWGVKVARAEREALELIDRLGIPVLPTWATMDMVPSNHPLLVGAFGTHGTRYGNFAVQNADLVISIGSRLDTHGIGSPAAHFAREGRKVVVDVDAAELAKFARLGMQVDVLVESDAGTFIRGLLNRVREVKLPAADEWFAIICDWKRRYPICAPRYYAEGAVNPYVFVKALANESHDGDVFFVDTGCALAWMLQGFDFKPGQRLYHAFNNTPMGYALPASVGASLALGGRPVTCVTGDGSLQVNIQELATVRRHNLPIKIILVNNHGYSMIQQTQDQWLGSRYEASTVEGGLAFPDFCRVAEAYGYPTVTISTNRQLPQALREAINCEGPVFCNVEIAQWHRVVPQVKFGWPIEDAEPLLDRAEFLANMLVKPVARLARRRKPAAGPLKAAEAP